ncbi:succinate dehydrogenase / fumarate reductase cytochrome b subunit [Cyclobacterium xiamenense]|uniref:Succinate dehydrogenase / fumarate reductase cytochrome b subunit n=1 Tax=Cyclobacterium xiamenense TaxID=1297121 RepID=A0A1H7APR0_9BACT|nr:succinate dehydrogenase cytochrome b subunit [Cyclobacterium xiamenense]SEJ67549.1 succinate dehydrogenase / fumarate reductase cytochrome b subunit [Cyclobacterium xiamenense]
MSWVSKTLNSTLGKKLLMALTGLFLILFLVVHLAGNLQLLLPDEGKSFNIYAETMASNPLIRVVSIFNFGFIALHAIYSAILTRHNKKSRPVGYAMTKGSANSTWSSRNMGILGSLILVFILIHLRGFWYEFKFGEIPYVTYEGVTYKNGYAVVSAAFENILYVIVYVVSMAVLAFHLSHGFSSAFQTLGINHKKYTPFIQKVGVGFAILVPALFALIPIIMFLQSS